MTQQEPAQPHQLTIPIKRKSSIQVPQNTTSQNFVEKQQGFNMLNPRVTSLIRMPGRMESQQVTNTVLDTLMNKERKFHSNNQLDKVLQAGGVAQDKDLRSL